MRGAVLGILGGAFALMSTAASAAITLSGNAAATPVYSGPVPTYTFEVGSRPPNTDGAFVTGSTVNTHVAPTGTGPNEFYYSAGPTDTSPGVLDLSAFGDIFNISFVWGSVDLYNTLEFLDSSNVVLATFTGANVIPGADGTTSRLVTFSLTDGSVSAFSKLRFSSSLNAFEIDNLAINPVPEPGTWALMLLGFAGIGMAMRRRRRPVLAQVA